MQNSEKAKAKTDNGFIKIQGARENNLKNIDIDIPHNSLVVITGLSGSGKSSLAFGVIYSEGQRRYVESMSAYVRQFLHTGKKADVDKITGLSPAIAIDQKTTSRNPRSTVGTMTEILDYLRLLFARVGKPYSPATGKLIKSQSVSEVVDIILSYLGSKVLILSPIAKQEKGEFKKELFEIKKRGFEKLIIDGFNYDLDDNISLEKTKKHDIEIIVDKLTIEPKLKTRIAASIELAFNEGDGIAHLAILEEGTNEIEKRITFSQKYACPVSGFQIPEIEPKMLSFNNTIGACEACHGLGVEHYFDQDKIIPDVSISISKGAIKPFASSIASIKNCIAMITPTAQKLGISLEIPFDELSSEHKDIIFHGPHDTRGIKSNPRDEFRGIIKALESMSEIMGQKDGMQDYRSNKKCHKCDGYRLKPEMLCIKIDNMHIGEVQDIPIQELHTWSESLLEKLGEQDKVVAKMLLQEISSRLSFLIEVGLQYITLSRGAHTLSGGESQRIRLASQIGSYLSGVIYVLDEPSIGLHPRDTHKLISILRKLVTQGNSVIVVEHDMDTIYAADHIIDVGPGSGINGGYISASGSIEDIKKAQNSITADYLNGVKEIKVPKTLRTGNGRFIKLTGACANNLKDVDLEIPLGKFISIAGVSGGGKSSLIMHTLYKAINKHFNKESRDDPGKYKSLTGLEYIDKIIDIDQSPIGRTPRSNIATYTGMFNLIRDIFAVMPMSQVRGYTASRFSFNVRGGRCDACEGDGYIKKEMMFMSELYVECESCKGQRYNRETLEVKYKGKSIHDVLELSIDESLKFFESMPSIYEKLATLREVGLGYLRIGQAAPTLSGGEAQRIKLSKELSKRSTGRTLYILDEPTTGLHMHDTAKLLDVLHKLTDAGNTIMVIEHNLDVIKTSDYVIDIGPEGGQGGGRIVAAGTVLEVANNPESVTGKFLKECLKGIHEHPRMNQASEI